MLTIQMYLPGSDERSRAIRRLLVRRALLMMTLLLRSISRSVRRRFPTLQDLVKNGIRSIQTKTFSRRYCKSFRSKSRNYDSNGEAVLRIDLASRQSVLGTRNMVHIGSE
jgi:hypothetical protein